MATDRLTCSRCDADLGAPDKEADAAAAAEFEARFGRRREDADLVVCSECYEAIISMYAEAGFFAPRPRGTIH